MNGEEPLVIRNDRYTWEELSRLSFDNVVISPGPGRPENARDFGVCREVIRKAEAPLLGICLGHQGLGFEYGARVVHAPEPVHGRPGRVRHDGSKLFAGVPQEFSAIRYHSLMLAPDLPACLRETAWAEDGVIMGIAHVTRPQFGIQYHPESICTDYGDLLLKNFRDLTPRPVSVSMAGANAPVYQVHSRRVALDPALAAEAFAQLYGKDRHAFWLDSSDPRPGLSRFSFMGGSNGPLSAVVSGHDDSVYGRLSEELRVRRCASDELPFDFNCGLVGYFDYEIEHVCFLFADRLIAIDHEQNDAYLVSYGSAADAESWFNSTESELRQLQPLPPVPTASPTPLTLRLARTREEYLQDIARCQQYIRDGESYEICLTNRVSAPPLADPFGFYLRLRELNPAPYAAFVRFGDTSVMSCSPERFLKIGRGGIIESKPIKGTRPRGSHPNDDEALRNDLATSEKDRSENLMIVDLLRNDLGKVCEMGSVQVPVLMRVESYRSVHQLVSTVRGQLRSGVDAPECIRAAFPGGSMTGAPKLRTMELIRGLEPSTRGIYSGALGYFGLGGGADFSIIIRTLVSSSGGTTIGTGGAIVALSDPEAEFEETLTKARALIDALILNARGSSDANLLEATLTGLRRHGHAQV